MTNIEKFQKILPGYAEAALITAHENQFYLTDFPFEDGYVLVTADKAYLICDFRYIEDARAHAGEYESVMFSGRPSETLAQLLTDHHCKTLAFEDMDVSVEQWLRLKREIPDVEWVPLGTAMNTLREQKNEEEIRRIKEAQAITDSGFQYIVSRINSNMTETEVALELEYFMRQHGAESAAFPIIAISGSATSVPHGTPKNRKLNPGFLTMDFGCTYRGFRSDMTRTVVIGTADDEMKRVYETVLAAQSAVLEVISDGCRCADMDRIARDIIDRAGYPGCFGHSLGHGVGIMIHEGPALSPRAPADKILCPGNVVTVEPGIYIEGKYGVRIEDMIIIGNNCAENITNSPKDLIEIM